MEQKHYAPPLQSEMTKVSPSYQINNQKVTLAYPVDANRQDEAPEKPKASLIFFEIIQLQNPNSEGQVFQTVYSAVFQTAEASPNSPRSQELSNRHELCAPHPENEEKIFNTKKSRQMLIQANDAESSTYTAKNNYFLQCMHSHVGLVCNSENQVDKLSVTASHVPGIAKSSAYGLTH